MKRIGLWVIAIVAMTTLVLAGCKKDRTPSAPTPSVVKRDTLKKFFPLEIRGQSSTVSYEWDNESELLAQVEKVINLIDTTYSVAYNNLGQPGRMFISTNSEPISETKYTLNAMGNVIRGDVYTLKEIDGPLGYSYGPDTIKSYYTLTYNTLNQLIQVSYFNFNGQKNHDEFFFYASDGNISEVNSSTVTNLQYDQLNGMGKGVKYAHLFYIEGADELIFQNKNNLAKINGFSRSYKYNSDQYPEEMTIENASGSQVYRIKYFVKKTIK